jgi:hypothetical protein
MDIYENIVIGNFLFQLGLQMGKEEEVVPICVTQTQQTPYDGRLSDVFITNSHFVRVLEFKRTTNNSKKEEQKLRQLQSALRAKSNPALEQISRQIHLYVESQMVASSEEIDLRVRAVPYLDFASRAEGEWAQLQEFVQDTANAARGSTLNSQESTDCKNYVDLLLKTPELSAGSSGALIIWRTDSGCIRQLVVSSLHDLNLTFRQLIQQDRDLQRRLDRGRDRGIKHRM